MHGVRRADLGIRETGLPGISAAFAADGRQGIGGHGWIEAAIAGLVVADEAVGEAVQGVTLPQHFLPDDRDLCRRDPAVAGLGLRAGERLADAEVNIGIRRDLCEHTVVVLRKSLDDHQRLAAAL